MSFPVSLLGVATALLLAAAAADLWRRRIPNAINAALGLSGLLAHASARGWGAVGSGLAAGVITLALLWVPWLKRWVGGGDVKTASGAAVWIGLSDLLEYLLLAAVAGGVVALIYYALSSRDARREIRMNLTTAAITATLPEVTLENGPGRRSVAYSVGFVVSALVILWTGGLL
jgi:Flp pilus assembly protein protease CpaA